MKSDKLNFVKKNGDFSFAKKSKYPLGIMYKNQLYIYSRVMQLSFVKARQKWWRLGFIGWEEAQMLENEEKKRKS